MTNSLGCSYYSQFHGPGNPVAGYNMSSLNYWSYQKSVNTKVVPFNELNNIAIEHFALKCTVSDIWSVSYLQHCQIRPRYNDENLGILRKPDVVDKNRSRILIRDKKMSQNQQSFGMFRARNRFYVKNKPEPRCEIASFSMFRNICRNISRKPDIRFQ